MNHYVNIWCELYQYHQYLVIQEACGRFFGIKSTDSGMLSLFTSDAYRGVTMLLCIALQRKKALHS